LAKAIAELKANSGTQFDPGIVKVFLKLLETRQDLKRRIELKKIK
jgi:HD-GYP domain-containing protein (c-di-GMP phosphodiesterase class II)